jgi:hypothetical protein
MIKDGYSILKAGDDKRSGQQNQSHLSSFLPPITFVKSKQANLKHEMMDFR